MADKQMELLALSRLPANVQAVVSDEVVSGEAKTVMEATMKIELEGGYGQRMCWHR